MKIIRDFKIQEYRNPVTGVKSYEICYKSLFGKWKVIQNKYDIPWRFVSSTQAQETVNFLKSL